MPRFSNTSVNKLITCHPELIEIAHETIKKYDFSIICGWRNQKAQDEAFNGGFSKLRWPNSKHNNTLPSGEACSLAFDFSPYPGNYDPYPRYGLIAGYMMGLAQAKGLLLRWGADWDDDGIITEHSLIDWGHIELVRPRA